MRSIVSLLVFGGASAGLLKLFMVSLRRHKDMEKEVIRFEPRSAVHVLVDQRELEDAVSRAARFEREVSDALRLRADHYESLIRPMSLAVIGTQQQPPEISPLDRKETVGALSQGGSADRSPRMEARRSRSAGEADAQPRPA